MPLIRRELQIVTGREQTGHSGGGVRSSSQEKMTFEVGFTLLKIVVKEASKVKVISTVGK